MHLTIEKTLGIAISLALCVGVGVPLFNLAGSAIRGYSDYQKAIELLDQIDYGVTVACSNNVTFIGDVYYPEGIELWSQGNILYCRLNSGIEELTRSFDWPLIILNSEVPGWVLMVISFNGFNVTIRFNS